MKNKASAIKDNPAAANPRNAKPIGRWGQGPLHLLFPVVLFAFFAVRGLSLGAVQMPFEGWDEYQHIAVAQFVFENGSMPRLSDTVPASMWDFLRRHPHPDLSARQLPGLPVLNHSGYIARGDKWVAPEPNPPPASARSS